MVGINRVLPTPRRNGSKTTKPVITEMLAYVNIKKTLCGMDNSYTVRSKIIIRMPVLI